MYLDLLIYIWLMINISLLQTKNTLDARVQLISFLSQAIALCPGILFVVPGHIFQRIKSCLVKKTERSSPVFSCAMVSCISVGFDHGMEMDAMQNQCIAFIRKRYGAINPIGSKSHSGLCVLRPGWV